MGLQAGLRDLHLLAPGTPIARFEPWRARAWRSRIARSVEAPTASLPPPEPPNQWAVLPILRPRLVFALGCVQRDVWLDVTHFTTTLPPTSLTTHGTDSFATASISRTEIASLRRSYFIAALRIACRRGVMMVSVTVFWAKGIGSCRSSLAAPPSACPG